MKKFLILIILLVSCENSLIEEIKETHTNGNPKLIHYKKSTGDTLVLFKIMNYHENGNIKEEESYKDNKLEGKQISYYDNGNIYSERNYKNGKKEGQWEGYWKNGNRAFEGTYNSGLRVGTWVQCYPNGNVRSKKKF